MKLMIMTKLFASVLHCRHDVRTTTRAISSMTTNIRRGYNISSVGTAGSASFSYHPCCRRKLFFAWSARQHRQQLLQILSVRRRQYGSTAIKASSQSQPQHRPPLPVRIALVSSTTALATPSFPALGFLYLLLRITTPDPNLRRVMEGRWGSILSFTTWTVLPHLYGGTVASLLLPCAVGNAIVAGSVYGLVDVAACNLSRPDSNQNMSWVLQSPMTGTVIGMTVGYVAPHYIYGPVMEQFYALEGISQSIQQLMAFPYATEVSVVTGAVAGTLMHPLLYYPINGVPGLHWKYFSGVVLAGVTSALFYVYYGRRDVGLPVPEGSYIDPSELDMVDSILRYNTLSGNIETYSLNKQIFIGSTDKCREGMKLAEKSRSYISNSKSGRKNVVFDDRGMAFVYNYWDMNVKTRYPEHVIHNIKTKEELQQIQNSLAVTDVHAAAIIQHEKESDQAVPPSSDTSNREITLAQSIVDRLNAMNEGGKSLPCSKFKQIGDVSAAVELLLIMKTQPTKELDDVDVSIQQLEQFVHRQCPELTLYTADEQYGGESIESQLRIANWKGPELYKAIARWDQVQKQDTRRVWMNRSLVVICGIVLSIVGGTISR
jgi:hypothetical protein